MSPYALRLRRNPTSAVAKPIKAAAEGSGTGVTEAKSVPTRNSSQIALVPAFSLLVPKWNSLTILVGLGSVNAIPLTVAAGAAPPRVVGFTQKLAKFVS